MIAELNEENEECTPGLVPQMSPIEVLPRTARRIRAYVFLTGLMPGRSDLNYVECLLVYFH